MYKTLFWHYWLQTVRAPGYYKNLIVNIFVGLMALYFLVILVMLGLFLPNLLMEIAPEQKPTDLIFGGLIYAVIAMLMMRFIMQPLSKLNLQSYQVLPVKRDTLVNYLLLKPLLNPLNYIALCFVIPFAIKVILLDLGVLSFFRFLIIVIFLIWFNTLMAPLLKRKFNNILVGVVLLLLIGGAVLALEYFNILSLFKVSKSIFGFLINTPLVWLSVILISLLAFFLNKIFFARNYYPESFERVSKKRGTGAQRFTFIERYGKIGEIISLEIKLVLRHKRTKSTLYSSIFFLFYGLIFYTNPMYAEKSAWLLFVAIFVTGTGMLMFGQWIINWDGSHFDFIMTRDIDTRTYIRANYTLMLALCIVSFILTTPYFLFGKIVIIHHLVAFVYNVGVNIYVYIFAATLNTKRLELSKGSSMNMQGVSYKNFLVMIPLLVIPIGLIQLFAIFSASYIALIIITLLGLSGILFREPLLRVIEKQFLRRKYALCDGFRKKE